MKSIVLATGSMVLICIEGCAGRADSNARDSAGDTGPPGESETTTHEPDDVVSGELVSWTDARTSWGQGKSGGVFSLGFSAEPPDGLFISAVSYLDELGNYCSSFEEDNQLQASSPQSHWVALVHLSAATTGSYDISWSDEIGGEKSSQVIFKRIEEGVEKERHTALSGAVEVREVPTSIDGWHAGTQLSLEIDADVSQVEHRELGCAVGGSDDEPNQLSTECSCEEPSGKTYTCEKMSGDPSCCFDPTGPREKIHLTLEAEQCAARCLSVGLLYNRYCQEL